MILLQLFTHLLPWSLRRLYLNRVKGYHIHKNSYLSRLSWIYPTKLIMESGAKIDKFTVAIHLDKMHLQEKATISRSNWITGFPTKTKSQHFQHQSNRESALYLGKSSAITKQHHIDCTNTIQIGNFVTIAGYKSQLLTHSIDVKENRQDSKPISIGDYCFVGTACVILGGATLPSYSVLGAMSLLNKSYNQEWMIYGGIPASPIKPIAKDARYFSRESGYVI